MQVIQFRTVVQPQALVRRMHKNCASSNPNPEHAECNIDQHPGHHAHLPSLRPHPLLPHQPDNRAHRPEKPHHVPPQHILQPASPFIVHPATAPAPVQRRPRIQPPLLERSHLGRRRHRIRRVRVRLDGEELRPQRRHLDRREAGGQQAVEPLRRRRRQHAAVGGPTIVRVRTVVVGYIVRTGIGPQRGGGGGGGGGFGIELRGRQLRVRGDGAVDVELGGRFARRGEPERGLEGRGGGEERAGVDEAEGAGGEGWGQVWPDEGFEPEWGGEAGGGDGEEGCPVEEY